MLGQTVPSTDSSNRVGPITDGGQPCTTDIQRRKRTGGLTPSFPSPRQFPHLAAELTGRLDEHLNDGVCTVAPTMSVESNSEHYIKRDVCWLQQGVSKWLDLIMHRTI